MKVGTDGVLLGASTPISGNEKQILDIGSGTGLLSLMLAQRCLQANITAIEIDKDAANESAINFKNSPFANRLESLHLSFDSFLTSQPPTLFDLIICNPPFFPGSQAEGSRKKARDSYSLPSEALFSGVAQLLSKNGQFSLIIPHSDEKRLLLVAETHQLFPSEIMRIRGRKNAKIVRSILHLKKGAQYLREKELMIELESRHEYSAEYLQLVKDFLFLEA